MYFRLPVFVRYRYNQLRRIVYEVTHKDRYDTKMYCVTCGKHVATFIGQRKVELSRADRFKIIKHRISIAGKYDFLYCKGNHRKPAQIKFKQVKVGNP